MAFYNLVVKNIEDLIKYKLELKEIYVSIDRTKYKKHINQITFKTNNYRKWFSQLEKIKDILNTVASDNDITKLKLSESMTKKLIEIFNKRKLEEIQLAVNEINKIKKENNIKTNQPSNQEYINKRKEIDDLNLLYGIAEKTAQKLYTNYGVTLERLRTEFKKVIKEEPENNTFLIEDVIGDTDLYKRSKSEISSGASRGKQMIESRFRDTKYLKYLKYSQLVGLKHVDNLSKRIPRVEITKMEKLLKSIVAKISENMIITVCGSYRRGTLDSGDIDVLLTHKKCLSQQDTMSLEPSPLNLLIHCMIKVGFLVDHLTLDGDTKYMGFCKIRKNGTPRRIDIRFVGYECYGAALLYFTGSMEFNKDMRAHALKKGYSVNEYKLTKMKNGKLTNEFVSFPTEEEICEFLDYPYKIPTERNM